MRLTSLGAWPVSAVILMAVVFGGGCAEGVTASGDDDDGATGGAPLVGGSGGVGGSAAGGGGSTSTGGTGAGGSGGEGGSPCVPTEEICDGFDNDCDDEIDEGCDCDNGSTQSCYSGPPQTQGQGECSDGQQTCTNGAWGSCTGDQPPVAEICDGLDNDCDGTADDGDPGGGGNCNTGQPGICADGTNACVNGSVVCQQNNQPIAEVCGNSLDDDCDGTVDNGCQSQPCDPLNPTPGCGSGHHCEPQTTGPPLCVAGVGTSTYYDYCTVTTQCNDTSLCHSPKGQVSICQKWCRIGASDCTGDMGSCASLNPQRFISSQEWGVCYNTASGFGAGPPGWNCDWGWNDSDCDCGCGKIDPTCPSPQSSSCDWCDSSSCSGGSCSSIASNENWHC